MNATSMFLAERQFADDRSDGPSASTSPRSTRRHRRVTSGSLVDAGVLVGTRVLDQRVDIDAGVVVDDFLLVHAHDDCDRHRPGRSDAATQGDSRSRRSHAPPARSMPVPTSGFSERSVGTAWRCMFAPISARLASSCSMNGTSAAATGHRLHRRYVHVAGSPDGRLQHGFSLGNGRRTKAAPGSCRPLFDSAVGLGDARTRVLRSPTGTRRLSVTLPLTTLRYGVSRKRVLVGARVHGQRVDQADVRAFRRFDRCRRGRNASGARRALRSRRARGSGRLGRAPRRDACA